MCLLVARRQSTRKSAPLAFSVVLKLSAAYFVSLKEIRMRKSERESLFSNRDCFKHSTIRQLFIHHLSFILQLSFVWVRFDTTNIVRLGQIQSSHQLSQLTREFRSQGNLLRQAGASSVHAGIGREEGSEEFEAAGLEQCVGIVIQLILVLLEKASRIINNRTSVVLQGERTNGREELG